MPLLFIVLAQACMAVAGHSAEIPNYQGYVNDYAQMLSPAVRVQLERALQSFDLSDSTQIAILTINSLEGDPIEDFSIRAVDKWKIGQKGKDNGILLLVAKQDKKIRIEVGRGLEGVLTDLLSGRIIDQVISPRFKQGKFDDGIAAGVAALVQATRGEFKGDKASRLGHQQRQEPSPLFKFLFFGLVVVAFFGFISKKTGMAAGAILFPLAMIFGLLPFSLLALLFFVPAGLAGGLFLPILLEGLMRGGGGFYLGGMGGGSSRGGSSFGGFGGGGFGGGGASGGW
ncbi:MAG: TPM domain-containing protein [Proteobacteria bacterium]|nr:TPM domain-containing protein [Pseudomonadota bacterium]MBU1711348.1 TPM domain-containing protein [Pseudomonadota bacterium]